MDPQGDVIAPAGSDGLQKLEAQVGKGDNAWDDGEDHEDVANIYVAVGDEGIKSIKFDYVENGEIKEGTLQGVEAEGSPSKFVIKNPEEFLESVKCWSDSSNIIKGIQFETNLNTSDKYGSQDGTEFSLQEKGKKIVGFHGSSGSSYISSLGAYFAPITYPKKLKAVGSTDEGIEWSDYGYFDGVEKIHVGQNHEGVSFLCFEYKKGDKTIPGEAHGKETGLGHETFKLNYPTQHITAVGVQYEKLQVDHENRSTVVTSLVFKTNQGTSIPYGITSGTYVELKEEGNKIVGFHGRADDRGVHKIGVYVTPI